MTKYSIKNLTSFTSQVFKDAVVETVVFVFEKEKPSEDHSVDIVLYDNEKQLFTSEVLKQSVYQNTHKNSFIVNVNTELLDLKDKIQNKKVLFDEIVNINQAIALKHDRSLSLFKDKKNSNYKPVIDGRNINRYDLTWDGYYLAYDVNNIHSCKRTDIFEAEEKIFFRRVGERLIGTYDNSKYYALNTLVVITSKHDEIPIKFILGIFNSSLFNFYYQTYLKSTKKVFSEIQARQVGQIPFPSINDINNFSEKKAIEDLVDQMISINQNIKNAKSDRDLKVLNQQMKIVDNKIDSIVYKLYDLTVDDIKTIEAK